MKHATSYIHTINKNQQKNQKQHILFQFGLYLSNQEQLASS